MRYLLAIISLILLTSCGSSRGVVEREMWQVAGERAYLQDSTQHTYRVEVLRLYDPSTGNLTREEVQQEGVEEVRTIYVEVRDTIYLEVERKAGVSAPIGEGQLELERTKTARRWAGAVPWLVGGIVVLILVTRYVWRKYY